jgi:chemosensory pili system protein ChpA (sensor histidine kinase/response regulator)
MPRFGKISLLIVEDDANVRFLLEAAARRADLFDPIVLVNDGLAALERLQSSYGPELPGLIATDLSMPRMTGLELLKEVKSDERLRHIPVAIITSSDLPHDRDVALTAGACSFVHKPYGVDALVRALIGIRESCGEAAGAAI